LKLHVRRIVMSRKSDTKATPTPPKKETHISKADELVKGSDAELNEEELKRVSGGVSLNFSKIKYTY
jgi:bacteriocin-like protein